MSNRSRDYHHRSAKNKVSYVYNDKFTMSDKEHATVVGRKKTIVKRDRILSNRDNNLIDAPSTTKAGDASQNSVKYAGQENQPILQHPKKRKEEGEENEMNNNKKTKRPLLEKVQEFEESKMQCEVVVGKILAQSMQSTSQVIGASSTQDSEKWGNFNTLATDNIVNDFKSCSEKYYEEIIHYLRAQEIKMGEDAVDPDFIIHFQKFLQILRRFKFTFDTGLGEAFTALNIYKRVYTIFDSHEDHVKGLAVIMWIANKMCTKSSNQVKLRQVMRVCSIQEGEIKRLLYEEKRVLRKLQFQVVNLDPMTFVAYYIFKIQVVCSQVLWYGTQYMLECSLKSKDIAYYPMSKLAAAALLCTLQWINLPYPWEDLFEYQAYHSKESLMPLCAIIMDKLDFSDQRLKKKYESLDYARIYSILLKANKII